MAAVEHGAHFDFIVVGAGGAGCVLANRLSEDPAIAVCVIEAGARDDDLRVLMPAAAADLSSRAGARNWNFETTAQIHAGGRRLRIARGRGWGGSSSISDMVYVRGDPSDYDGWGDLGLAGWRYADLLPYFKRSEHFEPGADPAHGESGPLWVSAPKSKNDLFRAFIDAAEEAGYRRTRDFNGERREGAGPYHLTIRDGQRCSASRAFLRPIVPIRANLEVISRAQATRVLIEGGRAVGVEYACGPGRRVRKTVMARREVIVSAGAIQSPHLLQLSGVGDPEALRRWGVPVNAAAPEVGRNLQDHIQVALAFECPLPLTVESDVRRRGKLAIAAEYALARSGPGRLNYLEAGAFLKSRGELAAPDLQVRVIAAAARPGGAPGFDRDAFTISAAALRPASRGLIGLASADPLDPPWIDPDYLASDSDRRTLRDGVRMVRDIAAKPALSYYRGRELAPGPRARTDAEIDAWVRSACQAGCDPAGTCRMGADEGSVVDAALRVRGVEGLRVADASVMPILIGADTNAAAIMIGEKAADLVLGRPMLAR